MVMPGQSKLLITTEELGPPQWVSFHPGELLRTEYMAPLGLSANALALALAVPANRITGILNGTRSVTADTAMRLARYFGTSAQFWLNMQQAHDLSKARLENAARIEQEVKPRSDAAA